MGNDCYGLILAGGMGVRMGNAEKPKQYMELAGKPILLHTLEKMLVCPALDEVIVLCPRAWIKATEDLIRRALPSTEHVHVACGGDTRNETIMNGIAYVEEHFGLTEQTVVVTHDAVRPFVTHRILMENAANAREYGACDTVIPASDTIVESEDGQFISRIPDRRLMYQGQTPQSFRAALLRDEYRKLSEEEKEILTDACKILSMKGIPVRLVRGEVYNIKITFPSDLRMAEKLLGSEEADHVE